MIKGRSLALYVPACGAEKSVNYKLVSLQVHHTGADEILIYNKIITALLLVLCLLLLFTPIKIFLPAALINRDGEKIIPRVH